MLIKHKFNLFLSRLVKTRGSHYPGLYSRQSLELTFGHFAKAIVGQNGQKQSILEVNFKDQKRYKFQSDYTLSNTYRR